MLLVMLLATGCFRGTVAVTVDGDRSGHVVLEAFPDADVRAAIDGLTVESLVRVPVGSTDLRIRPLDDGGRKGYRVEFDVRDVDAMGTALTSGLTIGGVTVVLFTSFSIREIEDGGWRFDATVNPAGQLIAGPASTDANPAVTALVEQLSQSGPADIGLTIALPGAVRVSNADSTSRGSATWRLNSAAAPPSLMMETVPAPLLTTAQKVAVGAGLTLLAGALLAAFGTVRSRNGTRRRQRQEGPVHQTRSRTLRTGRRPSPPPRPLPLRCRRCRRCLSRPWCRLRPSRFPRRRFPAGTPIRPAALSCATGTARPGPRTCARPDSWRHAWPAGRRVTPCDVDLA